MSDQPNKWLWDQPKSWHAMNRALHDIAVLLNYLNELPDSRLLSYFKATQDRVLDGRTRSTVPPCDSYSEFLDRLDEIAAAFQTGRAPRERDGSLVPLHSWNGAVTSLPRLPLRPPPVRSA